MFKLHWMLILICLLILFNYVNDLQCLKEEAETRLLSQQELDLKQCLKDRLAHLLREEEIKWFQRAKTRELLEGITTLSTFRWWQMETEGKPGYQGCSKMKG